MRFLCGLFSGLDEDIFKYVRTGEQVCISDVLRFLPDEKRMGSESNVKGETGTVSV